MEIKTIKKLKLIITAILISLISIFLHANNVEASSAINNFR